MPRASSPGTSPARPATGWPTGRWARTSGTGSRLALARDPVPEVLAHRPVGQPVAGLAGDVPGELARGIQLDRLVVGHVQAAFRQLLGHHHQGGRLARPGARLHDQVVPAQGPVDDRLLFGGRWVFHVCLPSLQSHERVYPTGIFPITSTRGVSDATAPLFPEAPTVDIPDGATQTWISRTPPPPRPA